MKLSRKPLYIFIAFGNEKIIRPEGPVKKNNPAPILSEKKNSGPDIDPSPPPPPPQNIKWTLPNGTQQLLQNIYATKATGPGHVKITVL